MEHKGVKYRYYRDPDVKDEIVIKSMIGTLAGYRENLKRFEIDPYFQGQVAGMESALTHIGVVIL